MQYFDLNYMLGRGTLALGDYDTPDAILSQMDYLGIDRALVWSSEARDWSAVNGNRELLATLEPYRERLFPCFVITPRDYYEKGTVEFYRAQCASGRVRAFRICPKGGRSPIRECEFVLKELAEYSPLVQIDTRELDVRDYAELEKLALCLPSVSFVLGQKVWCDMDVVFNLMKRCSNVLLDTSWLHVRGSIEMAIEHFGVERLLFATGHRSQYGAAIGALAHAPLTAGEREAIAHGNAEKRLGLAPLTSSLLGKEPEILKEKPLWRAFSRGEGLKGIDVVEAHTHQGGPAMNGYILPDSDLSEALPGMLRAMDRFGISHSIVIGSRALSGECLRGNRELAEQARPYRSRLHGYWVFNPWQCGSVTEDMLESAFADGFFVGFKTLNAYWKVKHDDPRFEPMWRFAEKRGLPVLMHTWNDVAPLWDVVPKYSHVKFIVAHSGGGDGGRKEALALAGEYSNVYLETCGTFVATIPLAEGVKALGPHRFLFGTDAALHDIAYELSAFLSMPLPDEQLRPILCNTFRTLCGNSF